MCGGVNVSKCAGCGEMKTVSRIYFKDRADGEPQFLEFCSDCFVIAISHVIHAKDGIKELAIGGLTTDGAHHKQWYLEEILKALGFDLAVIRQELQAKGYDWEDGVA